MTPVPACLDNPLCELAEGPLWHCGEQALYWTDILGGRLWRHATRTNRTDKAWEGPMKVGGFAFRRGGGFVLCTDKGVFTADPALANLIRLHAIPMEEGERFNDITTDPRGRVFAGTMKRSFDGGTLYRIERGREPVAVLSGIGISNGMTFSLDERTFFHTDSVAGTITAYDYDAATGDISNPRPFYRAAEGAGAPDGMTIDRDGCFWVACWGGSQVIRLNPEGKIIERFSMPAKQPSSVMFGGEGMDRLFVTSAHEGSVDPARGLDETGGFLGGKVYTFLTKTSGRPEWEADIE